MGLQEIINEVRGSLQAMEDDLNLHRHYRLCAVERGDQVTVDNLDRYVIPRCEKAIEELRAALVEVETVQMAEALA